MNWDVPVYVNSFLPDSRVPHPTEGIVLGGRRALSPSTSDEQIGGIMEAVLSE